MRPLAEFAEQCVKQEEQCRSAHHATHEGDTAAQVKSIFRVFQIIIKRLRQRGTAEAKHNRHNGIIVNKIQEFGIDFQLFSIALQDKKRRKNTNGNHDPIHVNFPEKWIR